MLKDIVQNLKNDLTATQNSVHDAFESHLMALAAEESRENNGSMIEMDEYRARFIQLEFFYIIHESISDLSETLKLI